MPHHFSHTRAHRYMHTQAHMHTHGYTHTFEYTQYLHGVLGDCQITSEPNEPYTPEMLARRRKKQYQVERELMQTAEVYLYAVVRRLCV
jgi:hypothetical protein